MIAQYISMNVLDLRDPDVERAFMAHLIGAKTIVHIDGRYMSWVALEKLTKPEGWE